MVTLSQKEMDKLSHLWEFHSGYCSHQGDVRIEQTVGGGIGTVTKAICGCGAVFLAVAFLRIRAEGRGAVSDDRRAGTFVLRFVDLALRT